MCERHRQKKIVILSRSFAKASDEPLDYLKRMNYTCVLARNNNPLDTKWIAEQIGDADAVIVGSDVIDRYVMDNCPNLQVISKHGVGLDNIDLNLAKQRGIQVVTTLDANSESVADFTIMLMLAVTRNLKENIINEPSPDWKAKHLSTDLCGKTVGLLGYGKIGSGVARRLVGFGVRILICDPQITESDIVTVNTELCDFDEMLKESDVVSLHLPLTDETRYMFSKETFHKMKNGAILINTARGGLINMQDLREALESGKLAGTGLDVYPQEPPVNEPILCFQNVLATPHIAPHTKETNYRMGMAAAINVDMCLRSECGGQE